MKNTTLIDTFDAALDRMMDGADAEHCMEQCITNGETLRPLLHIAQGLLALAEEAEAAAFAARHGAEALDWVTLLNGAPVCSGSAFVAV